MLFLFRLLLLNCIIFFPLKSECPSNISTDVWERIQPYLLPENHPAKKVLDQLFLSKNLLQNIETLKKKKFKVVGQGHSKGKVLKHKKLKKYLIKVYTDDQEEINEWEIWTRRIEGAQAIRQAIEHHLVSNLFTVPKKWIYQVKREGIHWNEKNFILLVEDMNIYQARSNFIRWNGNAYITKKKLEILNKLVQEVGLYDSLFIDNIPFTKDNKIAFIDTEHFHRWPIHTLRLKGYLSKKMQQHWLDIISKNP